MNNYSIVIAVIISCLLFNNFQKQINLFSNFIIITTAIIVIVTTVIVLLQPLIVNNFKNKVIVNCGYHII